jgi:hypothetical protein
LIFKGIAECFAFALTQKVTKKVKDSRSLRAAVRASAQRSLHPGSFETRLFTVFIGYCFLRYWLVEAFGFGRLMDGEAEGAVFSA